MIGELIGGLFGMLLQEFGNMAHTILNYNPNSGCRRTDIDRTSDKNILFSPVY